MTTPAREGMPELPFSPYLVSEWNGPSMTERKIWTAYTADQVHSYAVAYAAALSQPAQVGGDFKAIEAVAEEVEKSAKFRNDALGGLLNAISKKLRAALPHPQPDTKPHVHVETIGRVATDRTVLTAALTKLATMDTTPPPPSDAAQGVQAVRVDEAMVDAGAALSTTGRQNDPKYRARIRAIIEAALAAHKGEGNG